MDDIVNEELQIMNENEEEVMSLSSSTFELPIHHLKLSEPIFVRENTPISEVIEIMQNKKIGSILVVSADFKLIGILTERDIIMRAMGKIHDWDNTYVESIMTIDPLTLQSTDMIAYAMNNMHVGGYRHVPIVDKDKHPVGMISIKDVMSYILDNFPKHILNITGEPFRGISMRDSA
ncbi:MAG: CBS domain-containing protein [Bdellovibrio sp.]|nr:CBS domain-containing protein [Bdellovibrio sp.]